MPTTEEENKARFTDNSGVRARPTGLGCNPSIFLSLSYFFLLLPILFLFKSLLLLKHQYFSSWMPSQFPTFVNR